MRILTIIGARPQFIKASMLSRLIRKRTDISAILLHTGQHYDANMSDVFFRQLDIPKPDYHLGIGAGTHGSQTGKMLESIESVLFKEKPDWVLVYGDTNSTLAGALATCKMHIPLAHVEAGLRSFNKKMPEEINRVLTDHCSDLLFTPTITAVNNLKKEGIAEEKIKLVGDIMFDVALLFAEKAEKESKILNDIKLLNKPYVLATIHRAENTDNTERLKQILVGIEHLASTIPVVLPLHPRTKKAIAKNKLSLSKVRVIPPVGYLDMIMLEKNASLIVTDSGGVQKEAFFHKIPSVTIRDETEWLELVYGEYNQLVIPDSEKIVNTCIKAIGNKLNFDELLYGDGRAAEKIIEGLLFYD